MPQPIDIQVQLDKDGMISNPDIRRWVQGAFKFWAGKVIRLRVSSPKRSSSANRYYWGYLLKTIHQGLLEAGASGFTVADLHDYYKAKYLEPDVVTVCGEEVVRRPTTTKLDTTEFHDYMERIRYDELVLQAGIYLEEPDDVGWRSHNITEPS